MRYAEEVARQPEEEPRNTDGHFRRREASNRPTEDTPRHMEALPRRADGSFRHPEGGPRPLFLVKY